MLVIRCREGAQPLVTVAMGQVRKSAHGAEAQVKLSYQ